MDLIRLATLALFLSLPGCKDGGDETLVFDSPPVTGQGLHVVVDQPDRLFIENPPVIVAGGRETFIYRDSIAVDFAAPRHIKEVFIFHGVDLGDLVEMDTELYVDGAPVYLRSGHGPGDDDDAWDAKRLDVTGSVFRVSVLCRVTGVNTLLNRLAARPHWGVWVTFE